jgi:hypothetical protein
MLVAFDKREVVDESRPGGVVRPAAHWFLGHSRGAVVDPMDRHRRPVT